LARKSSLGPFPKTHRWTEIVQRRASTPGLSDDLIGHVRSRLEKLIDDDQTLKATLFFAALPVVTRHAEPERMLELAFEIPYRCSLRDTLDQLLAIDSPTRRAALDTFDRFTSSPRFAQVTLADDVWLPWRELDGSAFCELGRQFFACLAEQHLLYYLRSTGVESDEELVKQHAWELSKITQSFSARWFNKCAVGQVPEKSNVRWYLGHCLGKLDMELERELTTHVEPLPNPFRRKKVEPPSLGLGI
jgi:hypothetical protein